MRYNIVLVGVGGQGVLFSSRVIARASFKKGLYVRTMHYKGMAQRGGSVKSFVRIGEVLAPTVPRGGADLVVSFELAETLNAYEYIDFDRTKVIVCDYKFPSLLNVLGKEKYPEELREEFIAMGFKLIDPMKELEKHGLPPVVMNSYVLGVISRIEGFPLNPSDLKEELISSVKRLKEENKKAFELGFSSKLRQTFTLFSQSILKVMRELEAFFLEVSRALEDLKYGEGRNFRKREKSSKGPGGGYYVEKGLPYLLIFVENSEKKDLIYEFIRRAVALSDYSECYWSVLFGTSKGITFQVLPSAERMIEEMRELGEKDWEKALSWLRYHTERMGEPRAMISLLFSSPEKRSLNLWKEIWKKLDFLAILGPRSLGEILSLSDYHISFRSSLSSLPPSRLGLLTASRIPTDRTSMSISSPLSPL